jgi:hypothetical protein
MAHRYLYVLATIVLFSASASFAAVKIDSVYADSVFFNTKTGVISPANAFGKPDSQYATLSQEISLSVQFDLVFYRHNGKIVTKNILPIKPNATLIVWGRKNKDVDSSAGIVSFLNSNTGATSDPFLLGDGINIVTVPNEEYNYIEFSLPGLVPVAKTYSIDAVALVEDTSQTAGSVPFNSESNPFGLLSNFPNPFTEVTNINFALESGGNIEVAAIDDAGIERQRISLGYLNEGSHSERIALTSHGMFFLRLFVNGHPYGAPIKIASE